jgi:hypothetical protein
MERCAYDQAVAISEHEKLVITEFAHKVLNVQVDAWPDEFNRTTPDIDAVAGEFAIELTSLDSIPRQRERDDWFRKAIDGLESELSSALQFRLRIHFHVAALQTGQNWRDIRETIKAWVLTESPRLSYGSHKNLAIRGLPFAVGIDKRDRPPALLFGRYGDPSELAPDLAQVRGLFERKARKLRPYSAAAKTTILLVASQDIALMSPELFCAFAVRLFHGGRPSGVDQLWFADCAVPSELLFDRCS